MTQQEASGILQVDEDNDLYDAYDEQLFEYRKFFLSKAPVSKLFEARIAKMEKLQQAFEILGGTAPQGSIVSHVPLVSQPVILDSYQAFQQAKNRLKTQLSNTRSVPELTAVVRMLVQLEHDNAGFWAAESMEEDVLVSKEPDPMYLLEAIKQYESQGGKTFAQLKNLENNPPVLLVQEMKRLSLLFKKY